MAACCTMHTKDNGVHFQLPARGMEMGAFFCPYD